MVRVMRGCVMRGCVMRRSVMRVIGMSVIQRLVDVIKMLVRAHSAKPRSKGRHKNQQTRDQQQPRPTDIGSSRLYHTKRQRSNCQRQPQSAQ